MQMGQTLTIGNPGSRVVVGKVCADTIKTAPSMTPQKMSDTVPRSWSSAWGVHLSSAVVSQAGGHLKIGTLRSLDAVQPWFVLRLAGPLHFASTANTFRLVGDSGRRPLVYIGTFEFSEGRTVKRHWLLNPRSRKLVCKFATVYERGFHRSPRDEVCYSAAGRLLSGGFRQCLLNPALLFRWFISRRYRHISPTSRC